MGSKIVTDFKPVKKGTVVENFNPVAIEEQKQEPLSFGGFQGGTTRPLNVDPIKESGGFSPLPFYQKMLSQDDTGRSFSDDPKKKMLQTALPIAGDLALTAMAPQASIPLNASKWLRMGGKLVNLGSRALSSGIGSGAGSIVSDLATGEGVDVERAKNEALLGGGGEVGVSALGGIAKLTGKAVKPLFGLLPDITFSGAAVKNYFNKKFKQEATDRAESFLLDIAPESVKRGVDNTKNLSVLVNNAYAENSGVYQLYKEAVELAAEKEGGSVYLDDTTQLIADLFRSAKKELPVGATKLQIMNTALRPFNYSQNVKYSLAEFVESEMASPKKVEYLLANVFQNKGWNKLNPTQQKLRESLKESLMADLDKMTTSNVGAIKTLADREYKALAKFNMLRRIYNKALITADQATGKKALQPHKLYEEINANKKRILADKELSKIWPALKEEAEAARKAGLRIERTTTNVGPGSIFSRGLGGAAGAFAIGPVGVPIIEGVGAVSAWAFMSKGEKETLKKIFATVGKGTSKSAVHLGGQAVDFGERK